MEETRQEIRDLSLRMFDVKGWPVEGTLLHLVRKDRTPETRINDLLREFAWRTPWSVSEEARSAAGRMREIKEELGFVW